MKHKLKDYCFTADTFVPLLDGRNLTMAELVCEFGDGKPFYVYSYDEQTRDVSVGEARFPRETARNDKLYELALDAIKKMYSDTSVSRHQAAANLRCLKDEIDILLDTLI